MLEKQIFTPLDYHVHFGSRLIVSQKVRKLLHL